MRCSFLYLNKTDKLEALSLRVFISFTFRLKEERKINKFPENEIKKKIFPTPTMCIADRCLRVENLEGSVVSGDTMDRNRSTVPFRGFNLSLFKCLRGESSSKLDPFIILIDIPCHFQAIDVDLL